LKEIKEKTMLIYANLLIKDPFLQVLIKVRLLVLLA